MIKIAHASSLEKSKLQMKKLRHAKSQNKAAEIKKKQELGVDAYEEKQNEKYTKPLKDQVATTIWDYERSQFPASKMEHFRTILAKRIEELGDSEKIHELAEKNKLKRVLNELNQ